MLEEQTKLTVFDMLNILWMSFWLGILLMRQKFVKESEEEILRSLKLFPISFLLSNLRYGTILFCWTYIPYTIFAKNDKILKIVLYKPILIAYMAGQ